MCLADEQLKQRGRWLRVLAGVSLVAGLLLWNFARSAGKPSAPWIDATVGLLMGISLSMNLMLLVRARRCRQNAPQG